MTAVPGRVFQLLRAKQRVVLAVAALAVLVMVLLSMHSQASAKPVCERRTFEGSRFTVCSFDAERDELRLVWRSKDGHALRGFAALAGDLGSDAQQVRFAMNAGMFDDAGAPIGLLIAGSAVLHPLDTNDGMGNFYLKPNGVFSIDRERAVHVERCDAYAKRDAASVSATQSGPLLVIDGALHPAIANDGLSRTIRNGVGACGAHTALFAISEEPVSFGKLARLFRDDLHCASALYLDGAISSLWLPATGRRDAGHALGPMLVVLGRR